MKSRSCFLRRSVKGSTPKMAFKCLLEDQPASTMSFKILPSLLNTPCVEISELCTLAIPQLTARSDAAAAAAVAVGQAQGRWPSFGKTTPMRCTQSLQRSGAPGLLLQMRRAQKACCWSSMADPSGCTPQARMSHPFLVSRSIAGDGLSPTKVSFERTNVSMWTVYSGAIGAMESQKYPICITFYFVGLLNCCYSAISSTF